MNINTMKAKKILKDLYSYCDKSQSYFHDLGYDFKETDFDLLFTIVYLLNDRNAENDRLREENAKQKAILEAIDNEMMPLPFETDFDKAIKTAKSEAIKEFAERLKKVKDDLKYYLDNNEENGVVYIPKFVINNLVKEMTGGK